MKIAIIGSGIAGLTAAYYLNEKHDITVFEKDSRIGGHTATVDVEVDGQPFAIDTGFIVFNDWTYPNFIRLLDDIGVKAQDSEMSFSVSCQKTGLEYAGSNLNTLFAQRSNLVKPYFIKMVRDILRFNKQAPLDLENGKIQQGTTLGEYLLTEKYSEAFIRHYLVPMGAAIWSSGTEDMLGFPLQFFVRFFKNHGLLNIKNRPQWKTIIGGSREYLAPLSKSFADKIITDTNISQVTREDGQVYILFDDGKRDVFDQVIFATHSDQALTLLGDASEKESQVLSAIPYIKNDVVLHTDTNLLPKRPLAWSSWNYLIDDFTQTLPALTYNMNILQNLNAEKTFCVTLNKTDQIDPSKILGRFEYDHPRFTLEGIDAQQQWSQVNGVKNTWFCGAWWRNGFHEDGVVSALRVVNTLQGETEKTRELDY